MKGFSKTKQLAFIFVHKMQHSLSNYVIFLELLWFLARQKHFLKAQKKRQLKIKFCKKKKKSRHHQSTLPEEVERQEHIRQLHQSTCQQPGQKTTRSGSTGERGSDLAVEEPMRHFVLGIHPSGVAGSTHPTSQLLRLTRGSSLGQPQGHICPMDMGHLVTHGAAGKLYQANGDNQGLGCS